MTKKVTGKDLEKLIENISLPHEFKTYDKNYGGFFKGDPKPKSVESFLTQIGLPNEPRLTRAVRSLAKLDRDAANISTTDLKKGLAGNSDAVKKVVNAVIFKALKELEFKSWKKQVGTPVFGSDTDAMASYEKAKLGVDKDNDDIHIDSNFSVGGKVVYPSWFEQVETSLPKDELEKLARLVDPKNTLNKGDFEKVLKNPKHPQHVWAAKFVDDIVVMLEQKKIKAHPTTLKVLKFIFEELSEKINKIDTKDTALGRDKPIPNIPIQSRYGTRTGATTPETLQRIFDNLGPIGKNKVIGRKFEQLSRAIKAMQKSQFSKDIEKTFSDVIAYDYLVRIIQDYESSAGGFLFENFLAFLTSGTKEGGNLKIEDFSFTTGQGRPRLASAKLYKAGTTKFKGSARLFYEASIRSSLKSTKGQIPVKYVLAMKGANLEKVDIFMETIYLKPIRTNGKVTEVEVRVGSSSKPETDDIVEYSSDKWRSRNTGDTQMEFDWPTEKNKIIASIDLSGIASDRSDYNAVIESAMNSTKEQLGDMFKALNNFQVDSTKYFSILANPKSRSEKEGVMIDALKSMRELRTSAFTTFSESALKQRYNDSGEIQAATKGELEESQKITAKMLQKLIEEKFKK